jgi:hypothetical protein
MNRDELRQGVGQIRKALDALEAGVGERPAEGVRDLSMAVDNLRRSVWAVLTTRHSGNYEDFLARIRVRRAKECCEDVLADLHAETVTRDTTGMPVFHATLRELVKLATRKQP